MKAFLPFDLCLTGQKWSVCAVLPESLFPFALAAQYPSDNPETVQIALAGFALEPERTDTGPPVFDRPRQPVKQRIGLHKYLFAQGDKGPSMTTPDNPTKGPAMNPALHLRMAAERLPSDKFGVECSATLCCAETASGKRRGSP